MDSNEARVREVWKNIGVYGYGGKTRYVNLADVPKEFCGVDEAAAWSAAAAYTETVLEEARQLREEIAQVVACDQCFEHNDCIRYALHGEDVGHDFLITAIRSKCAWSRTVARLEAAYAVHIRGIKPEALSSAPEGEKQ